MVDSALLRWMVETREGSLPDDQSDSNIPITIWCTDGQELHQHQTMQDTPCYQPVTGSKIIFGS